MIWILLALQIVVIKLSNDNIKNIKEMEKKQSRYENDLDILWNKMDQIFPDLN